MNGANGMTGARVTWDRGGAPGPAGVKFMKCTVVSDFRGGGRGARRCVRVVRRRDGKAGADISRIDQVKSYSSSPAVAMSGSTEVSAVEPRFLGIKCTVTVTYSLPTQFLV